MSEFLPEKFQEKEVLWYYDIEEHRDGETGAKADEVVTALWKFFH